MYLIELSLLDSNNFRKYSLETLIKLRDYTNNVLNEIYNVHSDGATKKCWIRDDDWTLYVKPPRYALPAGTTFNEAHYKKININDVLSSTTR